MAGVPEGLVNLIRVESLNAICIYSFNLGDWVKPLDQKEKDLRKMAGGGRFCRWRRPAGVFILLMFLALGCESSFCLPTSMFSYHGFGDPMAMWISSAPAHYLDLLHGSPELKSSATLVITNWSVCLRPAWILTNVMFNLNHFFSVVCSAPLTFVL